MLIKFISQFTDDQIIDMNKVVQIQNRYYLVEDTSLINKDPQHLGVFLGAKRNNKFVPSFRLLEFLPDSVPHVVVDQKQAWLFVCGRDLFVEHSFPSNTLVLVYSGRGELLGYGFAKEGLINNLFDRGDFLRREQ